MLYMGSQDYITLVRLSKFKYDENDKSNMLIHLTNVSQQKKELEIPNDNFMLKSYNDEMYFLEQIDEITSKIVIFTFE